MTTATTTTSPALALLTDLDRYLVNSGLGKEVGSDHLPPSVEALNRLIAWLRPAGPEADAAVTKRLEQLLFALENSPAIRRRLADVLLAWLAEVNPHTAVAGLGIYSRRGFASEFGSRLYELINPAPLDPGQFKDALRLIFTHPHDSHWVARISDADWLRLLTTLLTPPSREHARLSATVRLGLAGELLYALEMLAIWVAAEELDPEIVRVDPEISEKNSAFVSLQREVAAYAAEWRQWLEDPNRQRRDGAHALVLLDQCRHQVERIRRRSVTAGTTIRLAHLLERLEQTLYRINDLLDILESPGRQAGQAATMRLLRQLLEANRQSRRVRELWQRNTRLIARSITENTCDHGEHYVTRDRRGYLKMLLSSAGAGIIIAFMALGKLQIGDLIPDHFAAIAGVWLTLAGLIAGYFDNRAACLNAPLRVRQHPWLQALLPYAWRARLGDYLRENYGALMGNFAFGLLLGMTGYLGYLLSLPLDIRHVAFASANWAYAASVLDPGVWQFMGYSGFVLLVGAVNLGVSFSLALLVALKARNSAVGNPGSLFRAFIREAGKKPLALIFPPGDREPGPEK